MEDLIVFSGYDRFNLEIEHEDEIFRSRDPYLHLSESLSYWPKTPCL